MLQINKQVTLQYKNIRRLSFSKNQSIVYEIVLTMTLYELRWLKKETNIMISLPFQLMILSSCEVFRCGWCAAWLAFPLPRPLPRPRFLLLRPALPLFPPPLPPFPPLSPLGRVISNIFFYILFYIYYERNASCERNALYIKIKYNFARHSLSKVFPTNK